jgi:hypothetical protein
VVHADHLRWVTRASVSSGFDAIVHRFIEDWRSWSEVAARSLVDLDIPPDGRVSSLTEGTYRAWLPDGWVESADAEAWMFRELSVLAEWAGVRKQQAERSEVIEFFAAIEVGIGEERTVLQNWSEGVSTTAGGEESSPIDEDTSPKGGRR